MVGAGGAGTDGTPSLILPACVTNLLAACEPSGACTLGSTASGGGYPICFASGVRVTHGKQDNAVVCGSPRQSQITTVTKADGSPCYSLETFVSEMEGCEGTVYFWRDAAGATVAKGVFNPYYNPSTSVYCYGGGSASCHTSWLPPNQHNDPCCGITDLGTSNCTDSTKCQAGICP